MRVLWMLSTCVNRMEGSVFVGSRRVAGLVLVGGPLFQSSCACLRVLRQGLLPKQVWSQSHPGPLL